MTRIAEYKRIPAPQVLPLNMLRAVSLRARAHRLTRCGTALTRESSKFQRSPLPLTDQTLLYACYETRVSVYLPPATTVACFGEHGIHTAPAKVLGREEIHPLFVTAMKKQLDFLSPSLSDTRPRAPEPHHRSPRMEGGEGF